MAKRIDRIADEFLHWYAENLSDNQAAAISLEKYISELLSDKNYRPVVIAARWKSIDSVRGKLLRKAYKRPRFQLTDRLGVRVILYHAREVDEVAALLRKHMQVREADSSDKRLALGLREFGYRSYHLVGSLSKSATSTPEFRGLYGQTFEVQIRSLLEHVWAEIEHDVVYKSGANWPAKMKRRWAALAGVLELLEHEFDQLEVVGTSLVDAARVSLSKDMDDKRYLDVPCMLAVLELEYPDGQSFRNASAAGKRFPPGIEQLLLLALRRTGIKTVGGLRRGFRSERMRRSVQEYAASEGIAPAEVSHLALLALLVAVRAPNTFRIFFPEFASDLLMRAAGITVH